MTLLLQSYIFLLVACTAEVNFVSILDLKNTHKSVKRNINLAVGESFSQDLIQIPISLPSTISSQRRMSNESFKASPLSLNPPSPANMNSDSIFLPPPLTSSKSLKHWAALKKVIPILNPSSTSYPSPREPSMTMSYMTPPNAPTRSSVRSPFPVATVTTSKQQSKEITIGQPSSTTTYPSSLCPSSLSTTIAFSIPHYIDPPISPANASTPTPTSSSILASTFATESPQQSSFAPNQSTLPSSSMSIALSTAPPNTSSIEPSCSPSASPYITPSTSPSSSSSITPRKSPSAVPSISPFTPPSIQPHMPPSSSPSYTLNTSPSSYPSIAPSTSHITSTASSTLPSFYLSTASSTPPSSATTVTLTVLPSSGSLIKLRISPPAVPSITPITFPSSYPSINPFTPPSIQPSTPPSSSPSVTTSTSAAPVTLPTTAHHVYSSLCLSADLNISPSTSPSPSPAPPNLMRKPSIMPLKQFPHPNSPSSFQPTNKPTSSASMCPTSLPSGNPTTAPSLLLPSITPSISPSLFPTISPSAHPTLKPINTPSKLPSANPSFSPTMHPSVPPSIGPSKLPTVSPSRKPSFIPTETPTLTPSTTPSFTPSSLPSSFPTDLPSNEPSSHPTVQPSSHPSTLPSSQPSKQPSSRPSRQPTSQPSHRPTSQPSSHPSQLKIKEVCNQPMTPSNHTFPIQGDFRVICRLNIKSNSIIDATTSLALIDAIRCLYFFDALSPVLNVNITTSALSSNLPSAAWSRRRAQTNSDAKFQLIQVTFMITFRATSTDNIVSTFNSLTSQFIYYLHCGTFSSLFHHFCANTCGVTGAVFQPNATFTQPVTTIVTPSPSTAKTSQISSDLIPFLPLESTYIIILFVGIGVCCLGMISYFCVQSSLSEKLAKDNYDRWVISKDSKLGYLKDLKRENELTITKKKVPGGTGSEVSKRINYEKGGDKNLEKGGLKMHSPYTVYSRNNERDSYFGRQADSVDLYRQSQSDPYDPYRFSSRQFNYSSRGLNPRQATISVNSTQSNIHKHTAMTKRNGYHSIDRIDSNANPNRVYDFGVIYDDRQSVNTDDSFNMTNQLRHSLSGGQSDDSDYANDGFQTTSANKRSMFMDLYSNDRREQTIYSKATSSSSSTASSKDFNSTKSRGEIPPAPGKPLHMSPISSQIEKNRAAQNKFSATYSLPSVASQNRFLSLRSSLDRSNYEEKPNAEEQQMKKSPVNIPASRLAPTSNQSYNDIIAPPAPPPPPRRNILEPSTIMRFDAGRSSSMSSLSQDGSETGSRHPKLDRDNDDNNYNANSGPPHQRFQRYAPSQMRISEEVENSVSEGYDERADLIQRGSVEDRVSFNAFAENELNNSRQSEPLYDLYTPERNQLSATTRNKLDFIYTERNLPTQEIPRAIPFSNPQTMNDHRMYVRNYQVESSSSSISPTNRRPKQSSKYLSFVRQNIINDESEDHRNNFRNF